MSSSSTSDLAVPVWRAEAQVVSEATELEKFGIPAPIVRDKVLPELHDPHVGMVCVVPGRPDTMRLNGTATLVRAAPFMDDMCVRGHRPALAVAVEVEEVFFHCPKAFRRALVWDPATWKPDRAPAPADIALALWRKGEARQDVVDSYARPTSHDELYAE